MRTRLGGLAACLIAASLALPARAEKPSSVDGKINTTLRNVINRGRDFYNAGDPAACYYLFEGSLLTVRPLLDHRPDVQKAIDRGLTDAARHADMRRRAWALRLVLDHVRAKVKGGGWTAPPPTEAAPPMPEATLWSRLGGEEKVKAVVDDFVALAAADPAVNFDRDGKLKFTEEQIADLKKSLVAFISQATGGPIKYSGKSMKEVHKGMGITNAEFDASAADLIKALEKNGVAAADIKALLAIVGTTRADIVEARKPEPEKPKEKPKDDEDKPKEKAKKPKDDDEKSKDKDEKPKKAKDDDDKPKEKAKKPKEDDEKPKKDKDDEGKPKEKEKIKKPKEDDEKPKDKDEKPKKAKDDDDKPKEKEKIKKPKEDDDKPKDKDEKPKEKDEK